MKNMLTSVKAETTDAVLPNCVGCSVWNTRRRFFANLVLTCEVTECTSNHTIQNRVLKVLTNSLLSEFVFNAENPS